MQFQIETGRRVDGTDRTVRPTLRSKRQGGWFQNDEQNGDCPRWRSHAISYLILWIDLCTGFFANTQAATLTFTEAWQQVLEANPALGATRVETDRRDKERQSARRLAHLYRRPHPRSEQRRQESTKSSAN